MWTYFAEFQPAARRGGALSVLATFWMVGNVVVAGLAWAIIPHQVRHTALQEGLSTALAASVMQLSWASWRLFTLACAVPSLLVTVTFVFMPESPKFLVCQVWCPLCIHTRYHSYTLWQGRHEEALELLRTIYSSNTRDSSAHYKVASLGREDCCTSPRQSQGLGEIVQKVGHLHKYTSLILVCIIIKPCADIRISAGAVDGLAVAGDPGHAHHQLLHPVRLLRPLVLVP